MARITINGVSLDPAADARALSARSLDSTDTSQSNYILVQTRDVPGPREKEQLAAAGAVIHEHVGDNTYLCSYKPADLTPVRELEFVQWANKYLEGFKVAPTLRSGERTSAQATASLSEDVAHSRTFREVDVVFHNDIDPSDQKLRAELAAAAHVELAALQLGRNKARFVTQEGYLPQIAALDEVRHIEEVPKRRLFNNVAGRILDAATVVINGSPYKGDGQVVAVADTGLDKGSTEDVHPAFTGRVAKLYAFGRTKPDKMDDPEGHGTHVAGSVLGDGNSASMGGPIQGTAPAATLVLQSLLDSEGELGGIPADLHDLFLPPYNDDGARVHTNSWGSKKPGLPYDQSAREIDDVVWNHQDLVICFAAGNDGTDASGKGTVDPKSVGSEAAAKNCITVGASESMRPELNITYGSIRPDRFPADPINKDLMADNENGLAGFSSRGPTAEGRFKPDVCGPGTSILSTLSRAVAKPSTTFGASSDPAFFFDTGTSMATPLVAGCAAVLRGALIAGGTTSPSAALIKALLINGAVELAGQYNPSEAGPSPNDNSGWGRVKLGTSFLQASASASCADAGPIEQGAEDKITVNVPQGGDCTLKVTLAWTDYPGPELQNDLDLIVRGSDGTERHGNQGTGSEFDRVNNVEQVVWENVPTGEVTIAVKAFRITTGPQPYAYAWTLTGGSGSGGGGTEGGSSSGGSGGSESGSGESSGTGSGSETAS